MVTRTRLAAAGATLILVVAVVTAIAVVGHQGDPRVEVPFALFSILGGSGLALTGMLLLGLRPGHGLGPVLAVTGNALVLEFTLREIAFAGGADVWVPTAVWLSLISDVVWFPLGIALVLLLFPNGRPSTARWAWVVRGVLVLAGVRVVLRALANGPLVAESHSLTVDWSGIMDADGVAGLLDLVSILVLPIAVVSLILRFRRTGAEDRQRLKPLGLAALVIVAGLLVQLLPGLHAVGVGGFVVGITVALPVALAVGAFRYRVWDLDPVLIGTLVYTGLAALVSGVYIAVVVLFSEIVGSKVATPDLAPSITATALIAVLFGPTKQYLGGVARRLVYGVRSSPYAVLNALPHHLAEAPAATDLLPRTAETLAQGLGVPAARVRALLEDGTRLESWSPRSAGASEDDLLVVPVRHVATIVGDVAVKPSPDRPLGAQDLALLADLAAQAGPAIRAVSLDAALHERLRQIEVQAVDLRESRQRIVDAQVTERRRIERDIHDGAQQQLVGLAVRLRRADELVEEPDAARAQLAAAAAELSLCIDGLRELARGIYPPVLTARGLAAALRAQVRTAPNEVSVQSTPALDRDRPAGAVEVAAYFCCLEAIQNAAKHAPDARVVVRLDRTENEVLLEVSDDGPGFENTASTIEGSGLLGMRDRVGAAGGSFELVSAPGAGTTVHARIPSRGHP
jgi:signal transduction histidine kinase